MKSTPRILVTLLAALGAATVAFGQQTPLPGSAIPMFVDPLPDLALINAPANSDQITLNMCEFKANMMPAGFAAATGTYTGTYVWGYRQGACPGTTQNTYIGPVFLATRGIPTEIKYVNMLGTVEGSGVLAYKESTDETLHWADPSGQMCHDKIVPGQAPTENCGNHYTGPIPAVPHLHGGEVPPVIDGGPDAWFLSDGSKVGKSFYSKDGKSAKNYAIYRYPNSQEAASIWFHDHTLGATRLNVYAGLAGAYLLKDDALTLPTGLTPFGIGTETIIPLVIQDRMFDTDGQLYFPNIGINPEHPFWLPEFVGDTIVVNGKAWPTIGTAASPLPSKRYRFLFLNGSNARTYELYLADPVTKVMGPPMWVIGTDGGYLDTPQKIDPNAAKPAPTKLVLMPGERYDVIIDFNDPTWRALNPGFSGTLILRNTGRTPYPKGASPQGSTVGQIVKFFIGAQEEDTGYNPDPATLGGQALRPAMKRLVNAAAGTALVTPDLTRQLTLNEVMGPGGPLEVLVNNTRWGGHSLGNYFTDGIRSDFTAASSLDEHLYYSELPKEGETEQWEIVNLTADAHPIHLHLVQFQLMNRQNFNVNKYMGVYNAAFPGGGFIGGFGPPADYNTGKKWSFMDTFNGAQVTTLKGGNPDVTKYLQGPVTPPANYESGWKDTVIMYPGQVTRIMVRWAPTDLPTTTPKANAYFTFNPDDGEGYVWHCHIIDHEDNEMMRPDMVQENTNAGTRSYTDY